MTAQILGLLGSSLVLVLCVYLFWLSARQLANTKREAARFRLFAARDHLYRVAASGRLDVNSEAFRSLVTWVNGVLHFADDLGFVELTALMRASQDPDAQRDADRILKTLNDDERQAVQEIANLIGEAMFKLIRVNSRITRLAMRVMDTRIEARTEKPEPDSGTARFAGTALTQVLKRSAFTATAT